MQVLTASPRSAGARSGTSGSSRIGSDELRWPAMETATVVALQRVRDLVARWKGRGGRGGASGCNGKAGQWLWPWQQRAAAVSALGHKRERAEKGEGVGRE